MRKQQTGLIERVAIEHGYRNATKVALFVASWAICSEKLGRAPDSVEEYADWWRMSRATAYREQVVFRECVPELPTPTPLWERVRRDHPEVLKRPRAAAAGRMWSVL